MLVLFQSFLKIEISKLNIGREKYLIIDSLIIIMVVISFLNGLLSDIRKTICTIGFLVVYICPLKRFDTVNIIKINIKNL